jgi:hypothetical protein
MIVVRNAAESVFRWKVSWIKRYAFVRVVSTNGLKICRYRRSREIGGRMSKKKISEQVGEIKTEADKLNKLARDVGDKIIALDDQLRAARIGVEVWLDTPITTAPVPKHLGYCRDAGSGRFTLAVRLSDGPVIHVLALLGCTRDTMLAAYKQLPELLAAIKLELQKKTVNAEAEIRGIDAAFEALREKGGAQ